MGVPTKTPYCEGMRVSDRRAARKREILEFAAHLTHSETVRDGRIDVERFLCGALLAFPGYCAEGAHVVQAVREFYENHADVANHGEQHFAHALGLACLPRVQVQLADLGNAVDAAGNFRTEALLHFLNARGGIFDYVVKQPGLQADEVHLHVGENVRYLPIFKDYSGDQVMAATRECTAMLSDNDGLDTVLTIVEQALPSKLRETAYAVACDIAAADPKASQEELRMLELIRHRLGVDRLCAAAIERGARARHMRL